MRKPGWFTIRAAVVLGILLGVAGSAGASGKHQGSFWYAFDNISEISEDARIIVWVTLPPEWPGQVVKVDNIVPEPVAILDDPVSGNRILEWVVEPAVRPVDPELPSVHQFFHFDIEVEEKSVQFDIDPAKLEPFAPSPAGLHLLCRGFDALDFQ